MKPHLRFAEGFWFCYSEVIPEIWRKWGSGATPAQAFMNWKLA